MASKRLSEPDTIYPPKKRALYEHMKHNGIDKFTTSQITPTTLLEYQDSLRLYGVNLPVNLEIRSSERCSRPRSDSLQSQVSSNSDQTETGWVGSRETSPCTIQALFDHRTPERNPITSLDSLKPDISKPLFPPCDSDNNSTEGSENHLSPENSLVEPEEHESGHFENQRTGAIKTVDTGKSVVGEHENLFQTDRRAFLENIRENVTHTFHENGIPDTSFQDKNVLREDEQSHTSRNQNNVYMGPMVSLLQKFNAEALQNSFGLKVKEHIEDDDTATSRNQIPSKINDTSRQTESFRNFQNHDKLFQMPGKTNSILNEKIFCRLCHKEFANRAYLHNHMKTHESKSIPCWVCKNVFETAENLSAHMKMEHKGENPFRCEHCSREFSQYNNLRRHMRVHREKVFKCSLCNREFNEEFYLKMHMGTHTGKRVYSCGVCGEGFQSNHDLKMHVKTHSPSLLHTCNVCGKSFSKACVLRQHKKGHSGERPHKCTKCEKTFIHRHHLTMHLKSHMDEKKLTCDICKKEFSQHSHLYKHLRAHDQVNEFGKDGDSNLNVENDRGRNSGKMETTPNDVVKVNQKPKVVSTSDGLTSKSVKFESREDMPVADGIKRIGKLQEQKSLMSHLPLHQVSHIRAAQSAQEDTRSWPSLLQSFRNPIGGYSSMPFIHGIPPSIHPGSTAHPLSFYNPLVGSRVPVTLPGYPSYNHLYRNYSEQMQSYYNSVYMMNCLSQNASLQKPSSTNLPGHEGLLQNTESERNYSDISGDTQKLLKPKVILGVETLDVKHDGNVEEEKRLCMESETINKDQDIEHIDVVNGTVELEIGTPERTNTPEVNAATEKDVNAESEKHEIAHELLKMSAGSKANIPESELTKMTPNYAVSMHGEPLIYCVDDTFEKTIKNNHKTTENTYMPKTVDTYIPKEGLGNLKIVSSTSPLQKLKMFVAHEKTNFEKAQFENGNPFEFSDPKEEKHVDLRSEISEIVCGSSGSEILEDQLKVVDNIEVVSENNNVTVENSLEYRLEKIKEFANIGQKLGKTRDKAALNEEFENKVESLDTDLENNVKEIERAKDEFEVKEPCMFVREGKGTDCLIEILVEKESSFDFFNDSLEERQLEIVESDDVSKNHKDYKQGLPNCEEKVHSDKHEVRLMYTEKEFVRYMSDINNSTEETSENEDKPKENSFDAGRDESKDLEKVTDVNKLFLVDKAHVEVNDTRYANGNTCNMKLVGLETSNVEIHKKTLEDEVIEVEAIDLRTVLRNKEREKNEFGCVVRNDHQSSENENMPVDLSLGGKRKYGLAAKVESSENTMVSNAVKCNKEKTHGAVCNESLFVCQFCDKTFSLMDELTSHTNLHRGMEKPYICSTCHRGFTHRHNLNRHKMSHNSKVYECNVCNRSFKEDFYLQMHMKTHTEDNCHTCQICGQNVQKAEIWQHTSQHLGNLAENPTYQQIGYRVKEILHEQNSSSESKKFGSEKCIKLGEIDRQGNEVLNLMEENIENWNVRTDRQLHAIDMRKVLQPNFYNNKQQNVSVLTDKAQRNSDYKAGFNCTLCNKVLQSKHELGNHMDFHNGTRPHVCNICGRAFKKSKGLKTHEKIHQNSAIGI